MTFRRFSPLACRFPSIMSQGSPNSPVNEETVREIRDLLLEIRKQNTLMKRYQFVFGAGLAVSILIQFEVITQILSYAVVVAVVMAILLTAPLWSQLIVYLTDKIPWYPKSKVIKDFEPGGDASNTTKSSSASSP